MKNSTVTNIKFKDGDGGGEFSDVTGFEIAVVNNGYIVKVLDEDGNEFHYVEHALDDVIALLREFMG